MQLSIRLDIWFTIRSEPVCLMTSSRFSIWSKFTFRNKIVSRKWQKYFVNLSILKKKVKKIAGAQKPGGGKSGSTAMGGGGGSSHWKGKVSSFKIFHQHVPRKWMNIFEQIKRRGEADDFMGGLHILWQPWKLPNKISHFFFFWRVCQFSMIGRRREGPRPWSRPCSNSLGRWTITSEPNNYEGITPCTILHNVQCAMHLA